MLEESERMIADTDNRLGAAVHDLRDLIVSFTLPPSIFLPSLTLFRRPPLLIVHATDTIQE